MYNKLLYSLLILLLLSTLSCDKSTKPESDYILIRNLTNGNATLTFSVLQSVAVAAHSDYRWFYEDDSKADDDDSLSFHYEGDYLLPNVRVVHVTKGEAAVTELTADCSRLSITNQTNATVDASATHNTELFPSLQVPANGILNIRIGQLAEGDSVSVNYAGRYVFEGSVKLPLEYDATVSCQVIPDAGSLEVVNTTTNTITGVYMQPAGSVEMGANLIYSPLWYGDYRIIKMQPQSGTITISRGSGSNLQFANSVIEENRTLTITVR